MGTSLSATLSRTSTSASSMPKYANLDRYLDPDTGVLKNKLDIRSEMETDVHSGSSSGFSPGRMAISSLGRISPKKQWPKHPSLLFVVTRHLSTNSFVLTLQLFTMSEGSPCRKRFAYSGLPSNCPFRRFAISPFRPFFPPSAFSMASWLPPTRFPVTSETRRLHIRPLLQEFVVFLLVR